MKGEYIMKKKSLLVTILFFALILGVYGNQLTKDANAQTEENSISEDVQNTSKAELQSDEIKVSTIEELNELVPQEIEAKVAALNEKYEKLQAEIDTYDKYIANKERIAAFYDSVYQDMQDTCICMREYCVKYAQIILESDKTNDEKYDDLEEMYDEVYDDGGDDIYDEFYDGILDDIYDVYYDGILDDAYDSVAYKEWSDTRSEEYKNWSNTLSDTYELWSDFRSDVYEFWSDMRGEFWDNDLERAKEKIQEFQDDILKIKEESGEKLLEQMETNSEVDEKKDDSVSDVAEMRPEFIQAMDSYESFMNEYCDFMNKYAESDGTDLSLLAEYANYMSKYADVVKDFEAWDSGEMNTAEAAYYLEVQTRISKKLMEVAE